jgi:hypothetical protein
MSSSGFSFEYKGIAKVLEHERLKVPLNQREYSWEEEHVTDLFQDFTQSIDQNKSNYFLGTVVLTQSQSGAFEVADGQQRLATTTILLAAIRDFFHRKKDEALMSSIENELLFKIIRAKRERASRLTLNVDDNEYFEKRILARPDEVVRKTEPAVDSHRRIDKAAIIAFKHIKNVLAPHPETNHANVLNRWVDFLLETAQVIVLKVPDSVNAYVMFETLNDRGLKVSQADLVKNYLFGESDERLKEAQHYWAKMSGCLESADIEDATINFLRHVCSAYYGLTREREVFEVIKKRASGSQQSIEFLARLALLSSEYVAMLSPDSDKWNTYPTGVRDAIRTLNLLNISPIRPLMMAVTYRFSEKELQKAFNIFISWTVRFFIAGGGRSGAVEDAYAKTAVKIINEDIKTAQEIHAVISPLIASDDDFKEEFVRARVSKGLLARYYLNSLEMTLRGDPHPSWVPNQDTTSVNLEHVLPQESSEHWPELEADIANANIKRIGNLALLQSSQNAKMGNLPFAEKRDSYSKSTFKLTEMIGEKKKWGPDEIKERQGKLAEIAVKTWPLGFPAEKR